MNGTQENTQDNTNFNSPLGDGGKFLAQNKTELNISFGLCVGHDILFNMKSKAPTTTLIVKDREHKNNTYQEFVK